MTSKKAIRSLMRRLCDIIYAVLSKNIPYKKPDNAVKFQTKNQSKFKLHKAVS